MKKILIALIVWGAITFINIDLFANSYQGITLDTDIVELNNLTLNEVFKDGNLYDPLIYNGVVENGISRNAGYTIEYRGTATAYTEEPISVFIYDDGEYYVNGLGINDNNFDTRFIVWTLNAGLIKGISNNGESLRFTFNSSSETNLILYDSFQQGSITNFNANPHFINLTDLGIEQSTTTNLDYYFDIYLALKNGINIDTFYNQGENDGYDTGYDTGYDAGLITGYDTGYDDGYGFGQEDGYDTGYLDGNVAGLETGYLNGYNDGFDDGILSDVDTSWLLNFVSGTVNVLGVTIVPGISLGVFVFIPLFFGFIGFIYRLGGRRG